MSSLDSVGINPEPNGTINGAWMPTIVFDSESGVSREIMQDIFVNNNVDARVFFWPLSSLPMFPDERKNINAWSIPNRAINLPSYHDLNESDIRRVVDCVFEASNTRTP